MRNGVTHEVIADAVAPASLKRAYRSTVVWRGDTYMQMSSPISNNWVKIVEANDEVYSIKIRMDRDTYRNLKDIPFKITPELFGVEEDETVKILQNETVWRLEPAGNQFIN